MEITYEDYSACASKISQKISHQIEDLRALSNTIDTIRTIYPKRVPITYKEMQRFHPHCVRYDHLQLISWALEADVYLHNLK